MPLIKEIPCIVCSSPSLNTICSNEHCSSWNRFAGMGIGKSPENPIIIKCPKCDALADRKMRVGIFCHNHRDIDNYFYKINFWYQSYVKDIKVAFISKYLGAPLYWDIDNQIVRDCNG